jgi:hypothetical protein
MAAGRTGAACAARRTRLVFRPMKKVFLLLVVAALATVAAKKVRSV